MDETANDRILKLRQDLEAKAKKLEEARERIAWLEAGMLTIKAIVASTDDVAELKAAIKRRVSRSLGSAFTGNPEDDLRLNEGSDFVQ